MTEDRTPYIVETEVGDAPIREVMTIDQVADYLQVSTRSVYALAGEGDIPAAKVAGQWRFLKTAIDRWLDDLSTANVKANAHNGNV